MIVTSAQLFKAVPSALNKTVKDFLVKSGSGLKGRYSFKGIELKKKNDLKLPQSSIEGAELAGINECKKSYCAVKLLNSTEKPRMEAAFDKLGLFQQLLYERIMAYIRTGEIKGSEEVSSNLETLSFAYSTLSFLPTRYPGVNKWISESIFKQQVPPVKRPFIDSMLCLETIHLDSDKVKPVLRIAEIFEFEEADSNIYFDLHLYSNHFSDSSLRIFEVLKSADSRKPSVLVLTDVMEIDELKKSGLIRALFKGKMVSAIHRYQKDVLDWIEGNLKG